MRTCGKLGSWNHSQGDDAADLASQLPADLDAATPSRISSELSLLFCATHSRGKAQAEHLVVSLGHVPMFSLLEVLRALEVTASPVACGTRLPTRTQYQVPGTSKQMHKPDGQVSTIEDGPCSHLQTGTMGQRWSWEEEEMGHFPWPLKTSTSLS